MFHSADPPFLVPTFNQKWLFVGHMNQGPTIQALEYRSIFTLGLSGPQQLSEWPVSRYRSVISPTTTWPSACRLWVERSLTYAAMFSLSISPIQDVSGMSPIR